MKKLGETIPSSAFIFKSKKTGEIIGGPRKLGDAFPIRKNVKDSSGHEHGSDGRFTGSGSTSPADIEERHTDVHGRVDGDGVVAETMHRGGYLPTQTNQRQAVFMIGGGGSGKGGVIKNHYIGTEAGEEDKEGNPIGPMHRDYVAPHPGFENQRVFDADREKKKNPLYSHVRGLRPGAGDDEEADPNSDLYGPSGPRTWDELAKYSPEEQKAVRDHVQRELGMSLEEFAQHPALKTDNDKNGTHFGGGLTHEVSSMKNKQNLAQAINDPTGESFVYDSVGSPEYEKWAKTAMDNGYHVTFHHVDTPTDIAQMRNQKRKRNVAPDALRGTHKKVQRVLPMLQHFTDNDKQGRRVKRLRDTPWTQADAESARSKGFSEYGPRGWGPQGKEPRPSGGQASGGARYY